MPETDIYVRSKRRFTISNISSDFQQNSRPILFKIMNQQFKKFCCRQERLSRKHNEKIMTRSLKSPLISRGWLSHVVTEDEIWVSYVTTKSKRQSNGMAKHITIGQRKAKILFLSVALPPCSWALCLGHEACFVNRCFTQRIAINYYSY